MRRRSLLSSASFFLVIALCVGAVHAKSRGESRGRDAECPADPVVCLCHAPPGNPSNAHTICVGASAVRAHMAHGDRMGACESACGGPDGIACEDGQFCKRHEGECALDAAGRCVGIPLNCPTIFAPVCGCDGETYPNACYADAAGVTIDFPGPCEPAEACGGTAGDTCEEGQYCRREHGECGEDVEGVCAEMPLNCPLVFDPVCGCDGMTYDNACEAAAAGVTVLSRGVCDEGEGDVCGGSEGATCAEGQFCKRPEGECAEDSEGVCVSVPLECPAIFAPVCGCDRVTYANKCLADAAAVTVASIGECDDDGEPVACGGTAGDTCDDDEYCRTMAGECAEGAEGTCAEIPLNCPLIFDPVCGCDGMTYDNACEAAGSGVNVDHAGECQG